MNAQAPPRARQDPTTGGDSVIRRFTLWWFRQPGAVTHVSANVQVDATAALAYIGRLAAQDRLHEDGRPHVTLQHLLAGAVGRALHAHPAANARIVGRRIVPSETVGLAMPVNLLGHAAGDKAELGMAIVDQVCARSLREIAAETGRAVKGERSGRSTNPMVRALKGIGARAPQRALDLGLDLLDRAGQNSVASDLIAKQLPVTAGLTNPGAATGGMAGVRFMGGAFSLPRALVHVGTVWGITPIQDEVMVVNGAPAVRPALPVMLLFDHRLIDGVRAGRLIQTFASLLLDPAAAFGEDAELRAPHARAPQRPA